jgi:apolipoprotein N-acyltransferase
MKWRAEARMKQPGRVNPSTSNLKRSLALSSAFLVALAAVAAFHAAYLFAFCQWCIVVFLYCLFLLARVGTNRRAFYLGLGIGFAIYAPHLAFFWRIFGAAAISLWCILSIWLALFVLLGRICLGRLGPIGWACVAPFLWTGLEYFRGELYFLRFSWLNAGYVFSNSGWLHFMAGYGVYGIGFLLMAWAAFLHSFAQFPNAVRSIHGVILAALTILPALPAAVPKVAGSSFNVTGVQLEFPSPLAAKSALDGALKKFPQTDLFVLSEYAFDGPIPPLIRDWCKEHRKWLAAGGKDPVSPVQYYNTVFVVQPDGGIAFQQVKCVPIQFMKDGLPARQQRLWDSPWGKLGFCICYDAGFRRVTDELIRQGAQALIIPTMDIVDWGKYQHELHGRIAPMRAAEYAVPVFRLCSSGISQFVLPDGRVAASVPFGVQDEFLSARLELAAAGRLPPDRWLAPLSVAVTAGLILWLFADFIARRLRPAPHPA